MTQYTYTAVPVARTAAATPITGTRDALDERELRDSLRKQGLVAVAVRPSSAADALRAALAGDNIKRSDRTWFFSTLAFMLDSAMPADEAIHTMEELAPSARLKRALADIRQELRSGTSLSQAIENRDRLASPQHTALVRVGESSGQLARVVALISLSVDHADRLRRSLISKLIYPAILLAAAVIVLWGLGVFVIPRFATQLTAMGAELPWQTTFTLAAADTLVWLIPTLAIIITTIAATWRRLLPQATRDRIAHAALHTPALGTLIWNRQAAYITDTMATMIEGGADALAALERAHDVASHPTIAKRLDTARSRVREGTDLAAALKDNAVLPPMINAVVSVGMRSGDLGPALRRASTICVEKQTTAGDRLLTLLEPAVITIMAASVFWVVYSLVSGMLAMTQAAQ